MSRRTANSEGGFTAIEMVIASSLMMVLTLVGFYTMSSTTTASTEGNARAQATTESAGTLSQIHEEATSANILYNPATEGTNAGTNIPAGFSLRIYTQANGILTCMQWRLLDGALQVRSWSDQWGTNGVVRNWSTLLTGITNPTSKPPFVLDQGANFGGSGSSRLLDLDFLFGGPSVSTPVELQSSIAGLDAEYYPQNTGDCSTVPSP